MALERGLAPDDETLVQLTLEQDSPIVGEPVEQLRWPDEPLRSILISKPDAPGSPAAFSTGHSLLCSGCRNTSNAMQILS